MKKMHWHPRVRLEVRGFPEDVRRELGYLLFRLQNGESLGFPASRPMSDISAGVSELRSRGADGVYRVFYFLKLEDRVVVFHAFKKKSQTTPLQEIKLGAKRLREVLDG